MFHFFYLGYGVHDAAQFAAATAAPAKAAAAAAAATAGTAAVFVFVVSGSISQVAFLQEVKFV